MEAPDLSQGGPPATSHALDELSANRDQRSPIAVGPENDEMALVNGWLPTTDDQVRWAPRRVPCRVSCPRRGPHPYPAEALLAGEVSSGAVAVEAASDEGLTNVLPPGPA